MADWGSRGKEHNVEGFSTQGRTGKNNRKRSSTGKVPRPPTTRAAKKGRNTSSVRRPPLENQIRTFLKEEEKGKAAHEIRKRERQSEGRGKSKKRNW